MRLRAILDQHETAPLADVDKAIQGGGLSAQMHRDDRARLRRDARFHRIHVDRVVHSSRMSIFSGEVQPGPFVSADHSGTGRHFVNTTV